MSQARWQMMSSTFLQNMTKDTCMAMNPLPPLVDHCSLEKSSGHGLFSEVRVSLQYHRMDEAGRDLWSPSGPTPMSSYTKLPSFTFSGSAQNFDMHWDQEKGEAWFHSISETLLDRHALILPCSSPETMCCPSEGNA